MPKSSQLHQNRPLENISIAYRNGDLVADMLFPTLPVVHESDTYYVYTKDNLRLNQTLRANGAEANEADWALSTASYRLDRHDLKHLVTDDDRNNADKAIKLDIDATEFLTDQILLRKEVGAATLAFTAANWANTTSLTSTLAWSSNSEGSNPILVAHSAASTIAQNAGKRPNVCAVDLRTYQALREHVSVIDRVKHTSKESVTENVLATLFDVSQLLVASGIRNTGEEALTDTTSFIWTDAALFCYIEKAPSLKKLSTFYQFVQNNANGNGRTVKKYRDEPREGDMVEVQSKYDLVAVASDTAYLVVNTVQ